MAKHPTIAFVSDAVYPYNKGGKETRLSEITTRLAELGYDVHIYCMKWWDGADVRVEHGVTLRGICPYIPLYDGDRRSIKQGILFGVSCFRLFFAKFDVVDVDHMPFFPLYSMRIVCWIKRKRMLATWHEVWGEAYWQKYLGGIKGKIAWWIERLSVLLPDHITAVSELTARRLKEQLNYRRSLAVVPNGIDVEKIASAKKSGQHSDVIYAGRLLKHKNVDVLIKAMAIICRTRPKTRAIIAGEGPEKESLIALTRQLKLEENIMFIPFQEDIKEMYGLIKSSKVFVLPSEREGFGLVVLEANACGVPVITVDCPDNAAKALIGKDNGLVVMLSVEKVAKATLSVLQNESFFSVSNLSSFEWSSLLTDYRNYSSI
jgi:glycosyltransferase involved in cell wall biosynthesis